MLQVYKVVLFFSLVVFSLGVSSQNNKTLFAPKSSAYIYSYTIDSISNVIYYGGNSSSGVLGALDGVSGNPLIWAPTMAGADEVRSILFSDEAIYFAGTFLSVKGSQRKNIAALDKSGNILPWNPSSLGVNITSPTCLAADKNYLYVGQSTSTTISVLNKTTGYLINDSVSVDDAGSTIYRFAIHDSLVFALTEYELLVYKWQYNALQEPTALKIVFALDLSAYGYFFDPQQFYYRAGAELVFINDELVIVEDFNYSGKHSGALKFKWNKGTKQLVKQNYDFILGSICIPTVVYPDYPDYIIPHQPIISSSAFYDSTLYFGGFELSDMKQDSCGDPFSILSTKPYASSALKGFSTNLLFGPDYYNARQLKAINNTLYQVSTRKYISGPDIYTEDYISAHCLTPKRPSMLLAYNANVCPEDVGVKYEVQNIPGTTYTWSYNGKGATINSNGQSSITMDFSLTPEPGDLTVIATSTCGLMSSPRTFHININTPPNANAGQAKEINCLNSSVILLGSSTTSSVMYLWKMPDGSTTPNAQPSVSKPGQYILTVTETKNGCHWRDTTFVTIDTIKPLPIIPSGNNTITCLKSTVVINGKSSGSTDSLRWKDSGGLSWANPLQTGNVGNYILIVLNKKNGCISQDSIKVFSNTTSPTISSSFTSADLTCKVDTLILNGNSATLNTKLEWIGLGDTLPNYSLISLAGIYLLVVTDTTNGCTATKVVNVNDKQTKPNVIIPTNNTITCSSPSIILNGSTTSPNIILTWSGPGNYSSGNPATVVDTGLYVLTVIDTVSGCVNSQQVIVDAKLSLTILKTGDTTICSGGSATLLAKPLGGTPGYSYTWMNKGVVVGKKDMQIATETDSVVYTVIISDSKGCVGTDSVRLFVPHPISVVVKSFQSCDPNSANGQLQVAATDGIPPYTYSIDGNNFQSSSIFSNLNVKQYIVTIKDALGCVQSAAAAISKSSLSPTIDFLVSSNILKGDTFVIVDISNPRPDKIIWEFPVGSESVDSNQYSPTITYNQMGSFTILMKAYFGNCEMKLNKTIHFSLVDSTNNTNSTKNGIEEIIVYPNPNNGTFNLEIKFYVKQAFVLQVYDAKSIEKYKQAVPASKDYFGTISILEAETGTYILKVTSEHDLKQSTIIVTQ